MGKVYVRWYGSILEGELLDGDQMGMKQVRIPLDGHHPVGLFAPGHVYQTETEASACSLEQAKPVQPTVPTEIKEYIADVYVNDLLERFKKLHWDDRRNHLRIDALDEFYQLWRQTHCHKPVEAPVIKAELPLKPPSPTIHHKPQPKRTINTTQLSLFD